MQFFVEKNSALEEVGKAENLVKASPHLADRFDAIKELRDMGDPLSTSPGFRRVASIVAPLHLLNTVLEPEFLRDKRKFYGWLDRHLEYCTYDRRAAFAKSGKEFHGWTPEEVPRIGGNNGDTDIRQAPIAEIAGGAAGITEGFGRLSP